MSKFYIIKLLLISICLCINSCIKEKHFINGIIEKEGSYKIGEISKIVIFQAENGLLNIEHTRSTGNSAVFVDGIIEPNETWFVVVVDSKSFYLINNGMITLFYETENESGSKEVAKLGDNNLSQKLPISVIKLIKSKIQKSDGGKSERGQMRR